MFPTSKIQKFQFKKKKKNYCSWLVSILINCVTLLIFQKEPKPILCELHSLREMLLLFNNLYSTHVFFFSHTHVPWQTVARRENANHFLIKYSFFSAFHYKPRKPKSKESIWYGCKFQIKISCPNVGCTGIRWHRAETLSFLQRSWTFTSFFFLLSWLEKITREIFSSLTLRDCEETITG